MDYSQKIVASVLEKIPRGTYSARDHLEDDGQGGGPFEIRLAVTLSGRRITFDFDGTAAQARGGINANPSIVLAACVYAVRCLCPERLPTNDGLFRSVQIRTQRGSLVDPVAPAAAGGNVETSQRLVDVAMKALAKALPHEIPACSAGSMTNFTMGGETSDGGAFAFYETLPGGAGGGPCGPGASGIQTHMTNTRNTPVEELERCYPLRVTQLGLRRGSGGRGRQPGGDGVAKEVQFTGPGTVSLFAERHTTGAPGARGGDSGRPGRATACAAALVGAWPRRLRTRSNPATSFASRHRVAADGDGGDALRGLVRDRAAECVCGAIPTSAGGDVFAAGGCLSAGRRRRGRPVPQDRRGGRGRFPGAVAVGAARRWPPPGSDARRCSSRMPSSTSSSRPVTSASACSARPAGPRPAVMPGSSAS